MMDAERQKQELEMAVFMLKKGHPEEAVKVLEALYEAGGRSPACLSLLGLSLAKAGGDLVRAERFCLVAIEKEFYWAHFYRNLAEVYLLWGKKSRAIRTIERGLKIDRNSQVLLNELKKLGFRRRPPLPFLSRANLLNRFLGKKLKKSAPRRP